MAITYTPAKWGLDGFGTDGGTVTYSFATSSYNGHYDFDAQLDAQYQSVITAAFQDWSNYGEIDFVYSWDVNAADIVIGWDYIDGAGNTLGQAYYEYDASGTTLYAEIRFDWSETWAPTNATTDRGEFSFEAVALHEIGHVLGFNHASTPDSIMYASYGAQMSLTSVDMAGIQALYGAQDDPSGWFYGSSLDWGGWNYGGHYAGFLDYGWHYEEGWEYGWYSEGSTWAFGHYYSKDWELGWFGAGSWTTGWYYDHGGSGLGWHVGASGGGWLAAEQGYAHTAWTFGWSYDYGGWDYGWHQTGLNVLGWHSDRGWDYGSYQNGSAWAAGSYYHSGWEYGWYGVGLSAYGWFYDHGGWGTGWVLGQ